MNSLIVTAPILAGKLETWNRTVAMTLKERRQEYEDASVKGGVTRLRVWHQQGADGSGKGVGARAPSPRRAGDHREGRRDGSGCTARRVLDCRSMPNHSARARA